MTALVLMYHRVARLEVDPFRLAVAPDRFRQHLEVLEELGRVLPLEEALAAGRTPAVALTFDDGYADNGRTALPAVSAAGLSATLFVTTGTLGRRRFWWDRLTDALLGTATAPAQVDVRVAGRSLWLDLGTPTAREDALHFLHRRLRPLPPARLAAEVDGLVAALGGGGRPIDLDGSTLTAAEVASLRSLPGISLGGHTRTHAQLRGQAAGVQREEVVGSVQDLADLGAGRVRWFAYPFGSPSAVGDVARRLAAEAGCTHAFTTDAALVRPGQDPYRLPRVAVGDWDGVEFRQRVHALLAGGA